jgi:hypothetical protein
MYHLLSTQKMKADNKMSYFTIKNHTFASLLVSDRLAAMSLIADGRRVWLKKRATTFGISSRIHRTYCS